MNATARTVTLIRTADHDSAERRALQRGVRRGEFAVVRPGVLVRPEAITHLRPEQRHLLLIRASTPFVRVPRLVSHASAAAVHDLPFVAPPPDKVQVTDGRRGRPDSSQFLQVHADSVEPRRPGRYDGLRQTNPTEYFGAGVTSLVRTLVDVAGTACSTVSVPMIDAALHRRLVLPDMLAEEVERVQPKALARARVALRMGSSLSPDQGVVVEVDGRAKYEDPEMLAGASTADAHWREKQREDFVRSFSVVRAVVRLTWADLMDPEVVRAKLTRAGIPCH